MRCRPLLHPVGPLPPSVYWARRFAVLAAATAVAGTTAVAAAQVGPTDGSSPDRAAVAPANPGPPEGMPSEAAAGGEAAPEQPAPVADPAPAPDAEPAPCGPENLAVRATADPLEGLAGVPIVVTVRLRAVDTACLVDVGPIAREAEIRSGPDRIWSSEDCESGSGSDVVVLQPNEPRELTVTWEGSRSAPECPPDLPEVRPGTYTVVVTVDGVASPPATFRLI